MPSRLLDSISPKSSCPLPWTARASGITDDILQDILQALPALAEWQGAQINTVVAEKVESHVGGPLRVQRQRSLSHPGEQIDVAASQEIVKETVPRWRTCACRARDGLPTGAARVSTNDGGSVTYSW
jgi:hypothetical protein